MGFLYFIIIVFVIAIIAIIGLVYLEKKAIYNEEIEKANNELYKNNEKLNNEKQQLTIEYEKLKNIIKEKQNTLEIINQQLTSMKQNVRQSFEEYCDILDKSYQEKEEEVYLYISKLNEVYGKQQEELLDQLNNSKKELKEIQDYYSAAILAKKREEELDYTYLDYSCIPTQNELDDIEILNNIKKKLHQPRILSMLIWSTYYQKPMTNLCNRILGLSTVVGIYKITNHLTGQCYIGQSVDIANRWKQHAKCGLGIDTPAANKLYKSMLEDGLHNFTFELIEKCQSSQLNEKEKFYIELYQSKEYGYNGTGGNK